MSVQCGICNRVYTFVRYYRQHLGYDSNRQCKEAYERGLEPCKLPVSSNNAHNEGENQFPPGDDADPSDESSRSSHQSFGESESEMDNEYAERLVQYQREIPVANRLSPPGLSNLTKQQEGLSIELNILEEESNILCIWDPISPETNKDSGEDSGACEATENSSEDSGESEEEDIAPHSGMLVRFQQYAKDSTLGKGIGITKEDSAGIQLMSMLGKRKCPLGLYEEVLKWHKENAQVSIVTPRPTLMNKLNARYNRQPKQPFVKTMRLPHSDAMVEIVVHDFEEQLQSLLSDPRILQEDYLFTNDDPFSAPSNDLTMIGEFNTGECYRKTYQELIVDPSKDLLVGIMWYLDAAVSGSYENLPIEALQFTLAIFNEKARNKRHLWRTIGYVTTFLQEKTAAEELLLRSEHIDTLFYFGVNHWSSVARRQVISDTARMLESSTQNPLRRTAIIEDNEAEIGGRQRIVDGVEVDLDVEEEEEIEEGPAMPSCHAQDLHAMLDLMLDPYRRVERRPGGTLWDFHHKGRNYPGTRLRLFTCMVKGDSQEADKHCGKYTSRGKDIAHLCRYCCCPNLETDNPMADFPPKTMEMVQDLVDAADAAGLKGMSQQLIRNVWYTVRWGAHNECGPHSGCLVDILHWLQLGKYKYDRGSFFEQAGKSSLLSERINTYSKLISILYRRQSDRDLPRTNFNRGIKKGKLMAHEMSGLMLVLLSVMRSTQGRKTLMEESKGKQKQFFSKKEQVRDWIRLIETMLGMEQWMNQEEIPRIQVLRFKKKIREVLKLEKRVANRQTGMGFCTFNFHAALHVADDMLNFGTARGFNVQSNEEHHKIGKTMALKTQKVPSKFDYQVACRLTELSTIEIAMDEVNGGRPLFDYTREYYESSDNEEEVPVDLNTLDQLQLSGSCMHVQRNEDTKKVELKMRDGRDGLKVHSFGKALEDFIFGEYNKLDEELNILEDGNKILRIYTEHHRFGQIFRATPLYRGAPWMDWVMIDWTNGITLPAQLQCFVDLRDIPFNDYLTPSIYAIVESADPNKAQSEKNLSTFFTAYTKDVKYNNKNELIRKFHIVDADSIVSNCCMIADVGSIDNKKQKTAYLRLLPRVEWKNKFAAWLMKPYNKPL